MNQKPIATLDVADRNPSLVFAESAVSDSSSDVGLTLSGRDVPRVLIFSQRNIFRTDLYRCPHVEFEDIIRKIDSAEILAPEANPFSSRYKIAKRVAYHAPVALNPGIKRVDVKGQYDLFFTICGTPADLLMVNSVGNWQNACGTSVCLIDEFWLTQMQNYRYFLHILKKFDIILLYYSQSVNRLSELIGRKCLFFPPGVDALAFCPYPSPQKKFVDILSIGRRSNATHARILEMAATKGLFYLYDSIAGDQTHNQKEHRALFANIAKSTRFFIVYPGLIDRPEIRGNQMEIGNRYFEGIAAGTVMVGERPQNDVFEKLFDWPDAVMHLPYDSTDIGSIITELDKQPERQDSIRRTNVVQALLHHDWAYRWEAVLKAVGLEPLQALMERKKHLASIAKAVS